MFQGQLEVYVNYLQVLPDYKKKFQAHPLIIVKIINDFLMHVAQPTMHIKSMVKIFDIDISVLTLSFRFLGFSSRYQCWNGNSDLVL